jgi:hypothetical protein
MFIYWPFLCLLWHATVNVTPNTPPVPDRINLSRTHAVKPCAAGEHSGISVKCNLGWSPQPSPDLRQHFRGYSSASEAVLTSQSDFRKLFVGNEKIGVLLLNLGGPETLDDVQPFLFNLFADPVITILQSNTCLWVFYSLYIVFVILPCRFNNCGTKIISGLLCKCAAGLSTADMWGDNFP